MEKFPFCKSLHRRELFQWRIVPMLFSLCQSLPLCHGVYCKLQTAWHLSHTEAKVHLKVSAIVILFKTESGMIRSFFSKHAVSTVRIV